MKWMREHDVFLRILALLIAVLMWIYVIRTQNTDGTETYSDIALQIEGIQQLSDNGLTIVSGADTTVSVKISGKRDRILDMNKSRISAVVNVSSITTPGAYTLNYTVSAEVNGLIFESKSPSQIRIVVDRLNMKSVPVKLKLSGQLPDGYKLSSWQLKPDAISLSGPDKDLAAVDHAEAYFDISDKRESGETSLTYTLVDKNGDTVDDARLTCNTPSTVLAYTISNSGAVPLTVDFSDSEYLTHDMITYKIEPSSIRVSGNSSAVSVINQISLGTISLRSVLDNGLTKVDVPIVLPNGVTAVEGEPSVATVTIETPGYIRTTFMLPAGSFPAVRDLKYVADSLEISIFCPKDAQPALTATDFSVTTAASPETLVRGENTIPLEIRTTVDGVVVIGKYNVVGVYTPGSEP